MDADLDLAIERVIRAPKAAVWRAWTDSERFERWWIPEPYRCRVDFFDPRSGGGFVTSMSENGVDFVPHMDAAFLVVSDDRIVFTNAVDSTFRPATPMPVPVTGEVTLEEHPDGTLYRIVARHGTRADREQHDALHLEEGWTFVTAQLAALLEGR